MSDSVAEKLRLLMDAYGGKINKSYLADSVNIDKSTLWRWLSGKSYPRKEAECKLVEALCVEMVRSGVVREFSPDDFFASDIDEFAKKIGISPEKVALIMGRPIPLPAALLEQARAASFVSRNIVGKYYEIVPHLSKVAHMRSCCEIFRNSDGAIAFREWRDDGAFDGYVYVSEKAIHIICGRGVALKTEVVSFGMKNDLRKAGELEWFEGIKMTLGSVEVPLVEKVFLLKADALDWERQKNAGPIYVDANELPFLSSVFQDAKTNLDGDAIRLC